MPRKKCPPGVFCIENATLFAIVICVVILALLVYKYVFAKINKGDQESTLSAIKTMMTEGFGDRPYNFIPRINTEYSNLPGDVLMNPYVPPQNSAYLMAVGGSDPRRTPLPPPIPTSGTPPSFTQLGLLTRASGHDETMLPLMGRKLRNGNAKWQYYAMSATGHSLKIPLSKNGRSCMNEYGCDELFNGDTVYAEGYKDAFQVTVYENQGYQY